MFNGEAPQPIDNCHTRLGRRTQSFEVVVAFTDERAFTLTPHPRDYHWYGDTSGSEMKTDLEEYLCPAVTAAYMYMIRSRSVYICMIKARIFDLFGPQ